jgi:MSHA biogenesis protein MshO
MKHKSSGFTLIELIMVIVLLGVMAVGITGFIGLSTQTYINVSERDELLSTARFAVERLNREIRNAVPNSIRVKNQSGFNCIEFVPIKASTTYLDIPIAPESPSNIVKVIPFINVDGTEYQCNSVCRDALIVYPLNETDVYADSTNNIGRLFGIKAVNKTTANEWSIVLDHNAGDLFEAESPTQRLFVVKSPVTYCTYNTKLYRFDNYFLGNGVYMFPPLKPALMADHIAPFDVNKFPFVYLPKTLQRNALVELSLQFLRNEESFVFDHNIHLKNVP